MFGSLYAITVPDWTNYFELQSLTGRALVATLVWIGLLAVAAFAVLFRHKERARMFVRIALIASLIFVAGIIIAFVVDEYREGSFEHSYQMWLLIVTCVIVIGAFVTAAIVDRRKVSGRAHTMEIVYAAVCIAVAFALSYIKLFDAPYGGSITLAQLAPIAVYASIFGWRKGVLAGLVFGLLQSISDPWVVHPMQYLLDYPLAFAVFGLAGVFRNTRLGKYPAAAVASGMAIGIVCRYICHLMSGAIFFGSYAADYGFQNAWAYSALYNLMYVVPDGLIAIVACVLLYSSKTFRAQANKIAERYALLSVRGVQQTDNGAVADEAATDTAMPQGQSDDAVTQDHSDTPTQQA